MVSVMAPVPVSGQWPESVDFRCNALRVTGYPDCLAILAWLTVFACVNVLLKLVAQISTTSSLELFIFRSLFNQVPDCSVFRRRGTSPFGTANGRTVYPSTDEDVRRVFC